MKSFGTTQAHTKNTNVLEADDLEILHGAIRGILHSASGPLRGAVLSMIKFRQFSIHQKLN